MAEWGPRPGRPLFIGRMRELSRPGRHERAALARGAGGDRVRYETFVAHATAPFRVTAVLRFQPIGWRWAHNLADYRAPETDRFVAWFDAIAAVSASVLARAAAGVQ